MIKPYKSSDFKLLENWVTDADLLLQFSGTDFSYPLTEKQIQDDQTTVSEIATALKHCIYRINLILLSKTP